MQTQDGFIEFRGYKTWYAVYGDIESGVTPLLVLHGGPGYPHNHLQNLMLLADRGIPVVLYDQLGCGNSDKPDDPELWTIELFVDELQVIRDTLGLEAVNVLGHSWGGTLAVEYALTEPAGLSKLVLSSPLLDTQIWVEEADKLKDLLPPEVAAVMRAHEKAGTTDSEAYEKAVEVFNKNFVCRLDPKPEDLQLCDQLASKQVYETMWGPSEAHATGNLKNWTALDRLQDIAVPTLLLSGKYDEATPKQLQIAKDLIPDSRWVLLENSSHAGNYEETETYMRTVEEFLKS